MSSLHFDPCQFAARRSRPTDAEYTQNGWTSNGIAFSDYDRMNTVNSSVPMRQRQWTPAFAASDEKLRRVLLHRAWLYLHGSGRPASALDDCKTINAAATKKGMEIFTRTFTNCPAHKRCESAAHLAAVKRAGGYLELQAALAYHAWRLGKDSVAIGETLGMSPQSVRVNLNRICEVARKLGYETFPRHYSFGRSHVTIKTTPTDERCDCIIALYKAGKNLSQIAQAIGYTRSHGNNYVRGVLLRAGIIYKRRGGTRLQSNKPNESLNIKALQEAALQLWAVDQASALELGRALIAVRDAMTEHGAFAKWFREAEMEGNRVYYCIRKAEGKVRDDCVARCAARRRASELKRAATRAALFAEAPSLTRPISSTSPAGPHLPCPASQ